MSDASPAPILIQLIGPPSWRSDRHAATALQRLDAALLALLAMDGIQLRERLAAWLWPDAAPRNAATNLRQHIFKLRKTCGHPLFEDASGLRLAAGVWVDVRDASPLPEGSLLAGLEYDDCDAFAAWLRAARQRLEDRQLDQLAALAAELEARDELAAAIRHTGQLLSRWPLHEHSWRRLMRLHYRRGDRAAAIDAFERFERLVREEQGSRPDAETLALLETIERLQTRLPPAPHLPACLQHPPVLVGRDQPMRQLQHAWDSGRAALVLGEGGIGKTRLLTDFLRERTGVLQRRARPGEGHSPYATLVLLLRELLTRWQPVLTAETQLELARLLPHLGPPPAGNGHQALLWQAVEDALRAAQVQGLSAVVLDDLHHADAATLELLRWLMASSELGGLRFAFAARPSEPGAALLRLEWGGDSSRIEPILLGPLDAGELHQLLRTLPLPWPADAPPLQDLAGPLLQHAGGHPFYTLETLKDLVRQAPHLQTGRPAAWLQAPTWPAPASAQLMIERSLQRLSPLARELAAVITLAASDWQPGLAGAVLQRPAQDLAGAWDELDLAQLTLGRDLAHDLVREGVLRLLPAAEQLRLHVQLAQALALRPDVDPARIASHWWAAEQGARAAAAWRLAAARARTAGRMLEQEELLDQAARACELAQDPVGRFDALAEAAATCLMRVGAPAAAWRVDALQALAASPDMQCRVDLLRAESLINQGQFAQALALSGPALGRAPTASRLQHDARVIHGIALGVNGRTDESVQLLDEAARDAAQREDAEQEANACAGLAHTLHAIGENARALQAQQRTIALARRRQNRDEIAHASANLATMAYSVGAHALGLEHAQEADAHYTAMQAHGLHWLWNRVMLARCALGEGRFDLTLAVTQDLDRSAAALTGPPARAMVGVVRAAALLSLGRADLALQALPDIAQHATDCLPMAQARVRAQRARALRTLGRDTTAELALLQDLAAHTPTLLDDAVVALDWAPLQPAALALPWLRRLRQQALDRGSDALARSLGVREVQLLLQVDTAQAQVQAQRLLPTLAAGLHASLCPAEAWLLLAGALKGTAARRAVQQARSWCLQARLPDPEADWRPRFMASLDAVEASGKNAQKTRTR